MSASANSSSRFRRAATAERDRLLRQREKAETRVSRIQEELQAAEDRVHQLDERIGTLQDLAGEPALKSVSQPSVSTSGSGRQGLSGSSIRETAVQVLMGSDRAAGPIHYRDWLDLLENAGYEITGKRPDAVFLNQIVRSPAVKSTTKAGVYELDPNAPEHLRERLARLQTDLRNASVHGALQAEDLQKLALEIRRVQRALEEAVAAFASEGDVPERAAA